LVWAVIAKPCGNLLYFLGQDFLPGGVSQVVWEHRMHQYGSKWTALPW